MFHWDMHLQQATQLNVVLLKIFAELTTHRSPSVIDIFSIESIGIID